MTVHRTRPTQARSAATRRRLLDAAFDSLYARGYAGTTSAEVCRRAGVSRGTLLHHFPSTTDLVTAAAEDIFARRLAEFRAAFEQAPRAEGRGRAAVAQLWREVSAPTFYAWLEILVAARSDRALRVKVRRVMKRFGATVNDTFAHMFAFPTGAPLGLEPRLIPALVFPLLNGLALDAIWADRRQADEVVTLLGKLAELLVSLTQAKEES